MAKAYAGIVGAVLLLVGIVGFVTSDFMGMHFNMVHNVIHVASGVIGLAAATMGGGSKSRLFAQVFGVVYTIVAIAGFAGIGAIVSLLDLNMSYNIVHVAVGVLGLVAGFMGGAGAAQAKAAGA
jgi:hypothetical protein